jgi:hypothetical protein
VQVKHLGSQAEQRKSKSKKKPFSHLLQTEVEEHSLQFPGHKIQAPLNRKYGDKHSKQAEFEHFKQFSEQTTEQLSSPKPSKHLQMPLVQIPLP